MEKWNHGLVWLQSGNNSHIAILRSLRSLSLSCNPFFEIWISLSAMLKTLQAGQNIAGNRHIHGQKENRLKLFRSSGQSLEKLNNSKPLLSRIEEFYFSKKVKSVTTSQYEISSKNHICSVKTFSTEHNLPIREKQIHWNKQHCAMSKSGGAYTIKFLTGNSREEN